MHLWLYLCLFVYLVVGTLTYSIPDPTIQLLDPRGVRISIPHERGIVLVAFHVNIDKLISLNEPGEYSADITEPTNGRWVFDNTRPDVNINSKVNYWVHVQYESYAYRKLGGAKPMEASRETLDLTTNAPDPSDCQPSITTVDRKTVCRGQLIFEDNFDILNLTTWQREVRISMDTDDAEFVSYQNREENSYVHNGQLHIIPTLMSQSPGFSEAAIKNGRLDLGAECTGINRIDTECIRQTQFSQILPPVVSARIRTKNSFSFQYGKVEVRAKLPKGDWLFPLILLEPLNSYYGSLSYKSGQMRIAFIRGNEELYDRSGNDISGKRIAGGVVLSVGEELRDVWLKGRIAGTHWGDDYHTYTLTWTDSFISVEVDGKEYANFPGNFKREYRLHNLQHAKVWEQGGLMAPFDREFYLTLGVAAGGHSDFPTGLQAGPRREPKPWPNVHPKAELYFWNNRSSWYPTWNPVNSGLHVDYVKVYAL